MEQMLRLEGELARLREANARAHDLLMAAYGRVQFYLGGASGEQHVNRNPSRKECAEAMAWYREAVAILAT